MSEPTLMDLMSLTVGANSFACIKYSSSSKPIMSSGAIVVPIGSELVIEGEIEVVGETRQLLADAVMLATTALSAIGQNVVVKSLGVVEAQILAAWCLSFGPRLEYKVLEQTIVGARRITFTATGDTAENAGGGGGAADKASQVTAATSSAQLNSISKTGTLTDSAGTLGQIATIEAAFRAQYALPYWSVSKNIQTDVGAKRVSYTFAAKEMSSALPAAGGIKSVDGTITISTEIDVRRSRKTKTFTYDLTCDAYPMALADSLRPATGTGEWLTRDSVSITDLPQWRLAATWVIESGSEGDVLTDWQHQWDQDGMAGANQQTIREIAFPGGDAILVYGPKPVYRYVQRGKAVGVGKYILPPQPMYGDYLESPPKVSFNRANIIDRETTWEYHFISVTPLTVKNTDLSRPLIVEVW